MNKWGQTIDYSFRYCPSCGSQAYTSLESTNAKPESFLGLFNSLYNLLADINNNKRSAYLPSFSEQIITRRCKLEYEDDYSDMVRSLAMKFVSSISYKYIDRIYIPINRGNYCKEKK